ncbi:HAMP domain-containing histidine kinase [Flavobacterium sp. MFBS3-15]|uniref:sensor histidine kinase n=1 Tax=Flavobacterium sp. MFBS3-15 TaxID=2989816 RepID=UPI002235629D|nr:HAMP domain-containing sensor histidine kinase [Flavobacterium sp. MFBS3-15]MCW4470753.1 HAMP domain-containing histidine kinase [Flavobacterium sp. MFBS3-15]
MNKTRFRLLVFFMSLSLIGIILVQLYWVNSSLKNNDEQFRFHIQGLLDKVTNKLEAQEADEFYKIYVKAKTDLGRNPYREDLLPYYERNESSRKKPIIYSDNVTREDYNEVFFDKSMIDNFVRRKSGNKVKTGEEKILKTDRTGTEDEERWFDFQLAGYLKDYRQYNPPEKWISKSKVEKTIRTELEQNDVHTPFEFALYRNQMPTKIKSDNLRYNPDPGALLHHNVFTDSDGVSAYVLVLSFPEKRVFLFSQLVGITSLSIIFTLIIIIAYLSAINQLIRQKHISEIKTDFINNMTHEFKTPIATINLALDAIKSPKIFDDKEKVQRYLQMIRDENKRMHSQVENVLQISKLEKKELEIVKEQADINDVLDIAIEHVILIIEARQGTLTRNLDAQRTTVLLNDVHFTNVIVNILDNAIKYSPDEPVIEVSTENVKDFVLIKIKDHGLGMSKNVQKKIFEKFYREHTGDIHNVKGHGLGLAYVKRIIEDHNCHIYVESEKGKGSTFIIKMPLIN